jgi:hypothetical protein
LREYGQYCGSAVAAGHARSGDAAAIWGYIGRSDLFEKSIIAFAMDYAAQVERDFAEFTAAADTGASEAA